MMKENDMAELTFANNITMKELNPHNFALKNTYISNLISTALNIIPILNEVIGEDAIKVTRGFISNMYLRDRVNVPDWKIQNMMRHTEGLALEFTWRDFEFSDALLAAKEVKLSLQLKNEEVMVAIDTKRKRLHIILNPITPGIFEETGTNYKLI